MRIPGVTYIQGRNSYNDVDDRKYGIAIHNTSNDASARDEASYATRRTDGVSAHLYVDRIEIIQSIDLLARTGHAGSNTGNENAISVEITGVNGWSRGTWLTNVNWVALGGALAWCCAQFGISVRRASVGEMQSNPKVKAFYSHDDMRRAWGGTDHTDPGPNFPWDHLFAFVADALNPPAQAGSEDDMALPLVFHHSTGAETAYALVFGPGQVTYVSATDETNDAGEYELVSKIVSLTGQKNTSGANGSEGLSGPAWQALINAFGAPEG